MEHREERDDGAKRGRSKSRKRRAFKSSQDNRISLVGNVQDCWTIINNLVGAGFIFL